MPSFAIVPQNYDFDQQIKANIVSLPHIRCQCIMGDMYVCINSFSIFVLFRHVCFLYLLSMPARNSLIYSKTGNNGCHFNYFVSGGNNKAFSS